MVTAHAIPAVVVAVALLVLFGLEGPGLLGIEAALSRDFPVVFGTLGLFTLVGLLLHVLSDMLCVAADPRIGFSARAE
jgi:microcin C transport system permease protein